MPARSSALRLPRPGRSPSPPGSQPETAIDRTARERLEAAAAGELLGGDQHGGRTVGQRRGRARGHRAFGCEGGRGRRQALGGRVGARTAIPGCWANAGSRFRSKIRMGPQLLRNANAFAVSLLLLGPLALVACGPSASSRLVITQSTDAPSGADHKGHLSPGAFAGITLSTPAPAPLAGSPSKTSCRQAFITTSSPTLGGNAIRTATSDPGPQGNPSWGTWTIPAGNGNTVSGLVLSFKVQAALSPGDYKNVVSLRPRPRCRSTRAIRSRWWSSRDRR